MTRKLVIAPDAKQDLAQAYWWYEGQRSGLGDEFLSCVDARIETIHRSPTLYAVIQDNCRRALVRRFPYAIFYEYLDDVVMVFCIFHTSRDPEKWRRRLP